MKKSGSVLVLFFILICVGSCGDPSPENEDPPASISEPKVSSAEESSQKFTTDESSDEVLNENEGLDMTFKEDARVMRIAEAYSLDAVDLFKDRFQIELDWSEESVRHVEEVMAQFHEQLEASHPSDEQVFVMAKIFGSYIGEVYRKNRGGKWGQIESEGQFVAGMQNNDGVIFWPWGRAENRLVNGAEDNVWHYYQFLITGK